MRLSLELVATGLTAVTAVGGGGLWLGQLSNANEEQNRRIEAVEQAPADIRALQEGQKRIERDISDIEQVQREILREIKK